MPKEEKRNGNQDGPDQMPRLSSPITTPRFVAEKSDYGRGRCIGNLSNEQEKTSVGIIQSHNEMEEDEEIGEPHTGTHVVEYMTDSIGELADERKMVWSFNTYIISDLCVDQSTVDGSPCFPRSKTWPRIDAIRTTNLDTILISVS